MWFAKIVVLLILPQFLRDGVTECRASDAGTSAPEDQTLRTIEQVDHILESELSLLSAPKISRSRFLRTGGDQPVSSRGDSDDLPDMSETLSKFIKIQHQACDCW